jgi:elongation factor P
MISVTDLKAGTTFEADGQILQVISYEHIKMGRGSANIKVKVRNLKNGAVVEKSFINGARVNDISLQKRDLQYLYKDEDAAYFMNPATYEQVSVPIALVPEHAYLKEGETFTVSFLSNEPLSVLFPPKMVFTVVDTSPAVRGNTVTNVFKDAVLDNGIKTKVPLFITIGESIRVDTRTGAYTEKA